VKHNVGRTNDTITANFSKVAQLSPEIEMERIVIAQR
jgi:hypothetical protein